MDFNDFDEQTKQEAIKAYVSAHPEIQEAAERRVRQKYEPPQPTPPKAPQPEGVVTVGGPVDVKRDPNPDRPGPRPRSGGISAFSSDGRGNFSRGRYVDGKWQEEEWSTGVEGQMSQQARMLNLARKGQQQDFGEFSDVVETGKRNRAQQLVSLQNSTASMMKLANGGMVPREAIELFNRKYGGDGVTSGLLPTSGFRSNGDFVLDFVQGKDAMGNPIVVSQKASPIMQWEIMNRNGVVFNDEDRANQRARLKKSGMSDAELDRYQSVFGVSLGGDGRLLLGGKAQGKGQTAAEQQRGVKDELAAIKELQALMADMEAEGDTAGSEQIKGVIRGIRQGLVKRFTPQVADNGGGAGGAGGEDPNVPKVLPDGNLSLPGPDGKPAILRPNQEYTNPTDGKKYIWRGGDPRNFEAIA